MMCRNTTSRKEVVFGTNFAIDVSQRNRWKYMFNHQFFSEFSQNFIQQVQRVLKIDGYLMYCIDGQNDAQHYHAFNISKFSLNDYMDYGLELDPVSFKRCYHNVEQNVALLNQHCYDAQYHEFMQRWKIQDTAEIFFRKRNGEPTLGLSIVREQGAENFSEFELNLLESFYCLSEKYFHQQTESIDTSYLSQHYGLTKKELVVMDQLLSGHNNNAIAQDLNCSLATIKTHIQHIYQKINVSTRQELMCKFLK